ncbi:PREDICTED: phospholipase A1-IIdelta-like [Ipomoea nil]|uniref:phospholipase A1-IIdelta-like n=1 Tax=Ipomoea nil TaxID=35883 RepID=UPI00090125E4|nr:PREDICTED: phospholipase A1-IIdelta-like [Ipomoea nil]
MATEPTWHQLLGSENWEGLLDPLNLSLRHLILRCGDFCQATYDSFNHDSNSKYAGSCRYGKNSFFHKVMLPSADDYQVEAYLYATAQLTVPEAFLLHSRSRESWDRESNWIGYVAVTSDAVSKALGRREIYVVFRGTTTDLEWINVFSAKPVSAEPLLRSSTSGDNDDKEEDDDKVPKVMFGWHTLYTSKDPNSRFTTLSAREQLQTKIEELRSKYKGENLSITLTGHSLGASLAILAAFDLCENGVTDIPVTAIVFGSPQIGNKLFDKLMTEKTNLKILHIRNKIDMIPEYPGALLGYVKSGLEFVIDHRKSTSLKNSMNPSDWHNLQAMLHVVAGWNGEDGEFELKVKRCVALVNKSCEFLKEELFIPGSWWIEKNKSMVLDENGEWVLGSPNDEDLPVPEY